MKQTRSLSEFTQCLKLPVFALVAIINQSAAKDGNHFFFFWIIFIQTYYQVVIASTSAGDKKSVSDGVTIVQEDAELSGVEVFDGLECNGTGIGKNTELLIITFRSLYIGVASWIPARSHTFAKIDYEIISMAILLYFADSRRVIVSYKRKYVHEVLVNSLPRIKVW